MEDEPEPSSPGREVPVFEQEKDNLTDPMTADDGAVTKRADRALSCSSDDDDGDDPYTCFCVWKPRWAQKCISPVFFLVCVCLIVCGDAVSVGAFTGINTSIEIRYRLTAANLGVLVTVFSAGNLVALPFMSYFGGRPRTSRPRWIAWGTVAIAVGTMLNALPQFVFGKYDAVLSNGQMEGLVCTADSGSDHCDAFQTAGDQNNAAFWIMVLASVVIGVGYAAIPTLSLSYIDDNCRTETTALYAGIIESMYGIGTMFGFFISSYSLSLWVDFYRLDPEAVLLTPEHPAWVGAWWLSLLICSLLFLLASLPLFGFPRRLPRRFREEVEPKKGRQTSLTDEIQADGEGQALRNTETKDRCSDDVDAEHGSLKGQDLENETTDRDSDDARADEGPIMGLLKTYLRLMRNPVLMFITVGTVCQATVLFGCGPFFPKYLESQFEVTASLADILTGVALLPPYGIGWILGGFIVRKTRMGHSGMFVFAICSLMSSLALFVFMFFFGCSNPLIAGVNVEYSGQSLSDVSLVAECNVNCSCTLASYQPVCDEISDVMYISPCFAGCNDTIDNLSYHNCSCLAGPSNAAVAGLCEFDCNTLVPFIVVQVLQTIALTMAGVPQLMLVLRFVDPKDKTPALGLNRCLSSVGALVGPMLYAVFVDLSCVVWQSACDEYGSCLVYDIELYRNLFMGVSLALGVVGVAGMCPAYYFIRRTVRKRADVLQSDDNDNVYVVLKDMKEVDDVVD